MSLAMTLVIVCAVLAGVAVLLALGSYRIKRLVAAERDRISADVRSEEAVAGSRLPPTRMEGLPAPARRYLEKSGALRDHPARFVHLKQEGEFRMSPKSRWSKMRAEQWFNALSPAFVWHATVKPLPLFWVEGRDSLLHGKGSMIIRLMSAITVVDERGHEMDVSSLVRYISEMPWFPSALLPSDKVSWEGIDDKSARATLRDGDISISMVFTFNEKDEIVQGYSDDRFGEDHRTQPWIVRYAEYKGIDGFRIPTAGEAAWMGKEGEFLYVKVRVTEMEYNRPVS